MQAGVPKVSCRPKSSNKERSVSHSYLFLKRNLPRFPFSGFPLHSVAQDSQGNRTLVKVLEQCRQNPQSYVLWREKKTIRQNPQLLHRARKDMSTGKTTSRTFLHLSSASTPAIQCRRHDNTVLSAHNVAECNPGNILLDSMLFTSSTASDKADSMLTD